MCQLHPVFYHYYSKRVRDDDDTKYLCLVKTETGKTHKRLKCSEKESEKQNISFICIGIHFRFV